MSFNYKKYTNVYNFEVYLEGIDRTVSIRPLTTKDIKKILIFENETDIIKLEEVIDMIFTNCVNEEKFNVDDLYIQDRYTLLLELRKITKGSEYSYTTKCTKCNGDILVNVDLNNIKHRKKVVKENIVPILDGALKLRLDYINRGEQKQAYKFFEKKKISDSEKMVDMVLLNMAQSIKGIITPEGEDTDIPLNDKMEFVENLPRKELTEIRNWYESNDFGADLNIVTICPHCENKDERNIEINNFFD